jgi:glycogen(starch) synthase
MHIAFVSLEYPTNKYSYGIGTYVGEISKGLVARPGVRVTVFTAGENAGSFEWNGVNVVSVPHKSHQDTDGYRRQLREAMESVHKACPIELVEFQGFRAESMALVNSRVGQVPRVVRIHGPTGKVDQWRYPILQRYSNRKQFEEEQREVSSAELVSCVSKRILRSVIACGGIKRAVALYNFLDLDAWDCIDGSGDTETRRDVDLPYVAFAGSLSRAKGALDVLNVATADHPALQSIGSFRFAGRCPRAFNLTRKLYRTLQRDSSRVILEGHLSRRSLPEFYRKALAVLIPSHYDPFPFICLEAMASGAVVVGCRGTGHEEMIGEDEGFLVSPGSVTDITKTLSSLLALGPSRADTIRSHARLRVENTFSKKILLPQFEAMYRSVLKNGN